MKKLRLLIFGIFIICSLSTIVAQKKNTIEINGASLIVPFSTFNYDTTMGKDALTKVEKLICSNSKYKIISFNLVAEIDSGLFTNKNLGNIFNPNIKKMISQIKPGKSIWIEEINAKGPEDKVAFLMPIRIKVQ